VRFRIDNADDCAIGWRLGSIERETGLFASAPEDKLAGAGPDRIDCDEWFAHGEQIAVEDLDDQQLAAFERGVLL
jgi:hypothetical protein